MSYEGSVEWVMHYYLLGKVGNASFLFEWVMHYLLQLQTIKAIIDSRSFKGPKSDEPRRVQVLDLYCLTRFESEGSSKGIVY